jgi:hypothetical protein
LAIGIVRQQAADALRQQASVPEILAGGQTAAAIVTRSTKMLYPSEGVPTRQFDYDIEFPAGARVVRFHDSIIQSDLPVMAFPPHMFVTDLRALDSVLRARCGEQERCSQTMDVRFDRSNPNRFVVVGAPPVLSPWRFWYAAVTSLGFVSFGVALLTLLPAGFAAVWLRWSLQ